MYFNNTSILIYFIFGIIGLLIGKFIGIINTRLEKEKTIFTKEAFEEYKLIKNKGRIFGVLTALIYISLLYKFGWQEEFVNNMELVRYIVLTPMLLSVFIIDYKHQIIPNRLNLTMFEIGLMFTFVLGMININIAKDMILGMLVGGGSFLVITLLGGIVAGKEAMGFGDVKLMGALGLYFGAINMGIIALISFLIGAILSIILLITKIKKTDEYIPFGPFIVISTFIMMFVPTTVLIDILGTVFTLGLNKRG